MDYKTSNQYQYPDRFAVASMSFGITSIVLCCTGVLGFPFAALAILFAVLSKRLGRPMHPLAGWGIVSSVVGMLLGVIVLGITIYLIETDPTYQKLYLETYSRYNQLLNP